jgi:hypothetical protein
MVFMASAPGVAAGDEAGLDIRFGAADAAPPAISPLPSANVPTRTFRREAGREGAVSERSVDMAGVQGVGVTKPQGLAALNVTKVAARVLDTVFAT